MMTKVHPYKYPSIPRARRHGPRGYKRPRDYFRWLEDEFHFRCAYCLKRMQWAETDVWSVDHRIPQSIDPQSSCTYDNLVLTCQRCNQYKYASSNIPDPITAPYGISLRVNGATGEVEALDDLGHVLIRELRLNHSTQICMRRKMLETLPILARENLELWKKWMGFPEKLHDLGNMRPPDGNTRPEGIRDSCHERRIRGELPDWYEE